MAKTTSQKTETVTSRAAHDGPVEQSMLNTFHSLQTVTIFISREMTALLVSLLV